MYDPASLNAVARMWTTLLQASDAASKASTKMLRPLGVSLPQARVLLVLSRSSSPLTRTEISRIVMRRPHTITALLNGMQRGGLIRRIKDDRNQQLVRIVMTEKGREIWKQVLQTQLSLEFTSPLSIEQFHQLISMLEKVRDAALRQL